MPTTPNYSFPYPLATDPADVPTDMRELAEAVDTSLDGVDDRVDVLEPKVATLETASADYDTRLDTIEPKVPANRIAAGAEGQVLTSVGGNAAWAAGAAGSGGELLYTQIVASVNVPIVADAAAVTVIPGTPTTYDGTPIRLEFYCPYAQLNTPNGTLYIALWDGGTNLGLLAVLVNVAGTVTLIFPAYGVRRLAPSPGSHSYTIKAYAAGATGLINASAGGSAGAVVPAFLRITRA